jgi:hypothetical protein
LLISEVHAARLDGVEPGVIIDVVAIVEIDRLFHGSDVEARQAADGYGEVAVGARIIVGPGGPSVLPGASGADEANRRMGRIHEAGEDPLCFFAVVRREGEGGVFLAGILPERLLEGGHLEQVQ